MWQPISVVWPPVAGLGYGSDSGDESEESGSEKKDADSESESEDDEQVRERIRRKKAEFERRMKERDELGELLPMFWTYSTFRAVNFLCYFFVYVQDM